jgi:ferric-dicitrate binding protein FerR (iron transport regulator)
MVAIVYKPATPSKNIQLELANGQVINLSNNKMTDNLVMPHIYKTSAPEYAILKTPDGKDYTMHLSDGTEVQLNAATTMRFPLSFTGNKREVFINGEAFLKVSPNKDKPFIVHLPHSTVLVLGTEFNVNTYKEERIALVTGALKVNGMLLKPGQEAVASVIHTFDETEVLSWRNGKFVFNNTTLEEVCKIIPRIYGISVELDNKTIADKRFSGVIDKNKPIEHVLEALKATNGIDYYSDNGTFHIR